MLVTSLSQCDVERRWPNTVNDCMISGDLLDLLYMTYGYEFLLKLFNIVESTFV